MPIILVPGIGPGFDYSPFSVYSVRTHLAIVVGLAEFGSAQPNRKTLPSNSKLLRKNTSCFTNMVRRVFYYFAMNVSISIRFVIIVRKIIRKRRLFKKVQAFCEEKLLRCLLGVFWYAESKNQCWQA